MLLLGLKESTLRGWLKNEQQLRATHITYYAEKSDNVEVRFLRQLRGLLYNAQQEKLEKHKQKTILDYCKDM